MRSFEVGNYFGRLRYRAAYGLHFRALPACACASREEGGEKVTTRFRLGLSRARAGWSAELLGLVNKTWHVG